MGQYYTYNKQNFFCKKCDWNGTGEQTTQGDYIPDECFKIECPKCYQFLGFIMLPTFDDVEKYGTDEDKARARWRKLFIDRVDASRSKMSEQLP